MMLIAVVLILAGSIVLGYFRGLVKTVFSLVSWIVSLLLVAIATPVVTYGIVNYTQIDEQIEEGIKNSLVGTVKENGMEAIRLPEVLTEYLSDDGEIVGQALEKSGAYDLIAEKIAVMIIQGVVFLFIIIAARILFKVLEGVLDIVSKIPGIREVNKIAGLLLGAVRGLILVWIILAAVAMFGTTETGMALNHQIQEAPILTYLYENNPVVELLVHGL